MSWREATGLCHIYHKSNETLVCRGTKSFAKDLFPAPIYFWNSIFCNSSLSQTISQLWFPHILSLPLKLVKLPGSYFLLIIHPWSDGGQPQGQIKVYCRLKWRSSRCVRRQISDWLDKNSGKKASFCAVVMLPHNASQPPLCYIRPQRR